MLKYNVVIPQEMKVSELITFRTKRMNEKVKTRMTTQHIVRVGGMPWPKTGTTHYHAQLGLLR